MCEQLRKVCHGLSSASACLVVDTVYRGGLPMDTMGQAKMAAGDALLLWAYASAVVGRTLTNKVLVFRDLTEASAGSSIGRKQYRSSQITYKIFDLFTALPHSM